MPPFDEAHEALYEIPEVIDAPVVNATEAVVPDGVTVPIVGAAGINVNAEDDPDAAESPVVFDATTEHV